MPVLNFIFIWSEHVINKTIVIGIGIFITTLSLSMPVYSENLSKGKDKSSLCAGCHGSNGMGLSEEFPNLAGQKKTYLINQLKAFKSGNRNNPTMNAMVASLTDEDIANLSAYYSSLGKTVSDQIISPLGIKTKKASVNEFPEVTFITMKKSGSVESFPSEKIWKGGPNMLYNSVSSDGKLLLATSPSSGSVYVFAAKTGKIIKVIKVGKAPKGVKISPDDTQAYVSNEGSNTISIVDLRNMKVIGNIAVEKAPHNVRFTKNGKKAYVTLQGGAGIGVIDTRQRKMVKVIPVPGITGPHNMDLSRDEKTAFIRDFVHHVAVLDLESGKVKKVIKVGSGHGGIDVFPNDQYVATAAIADNKITVIDTQSLVAKNIEVGNGPHGIRASKDSQWIYVTLTKDNVVAVVNTRTMEVEKRITVEKFPFWVAVRGNP